MKTQKKLFKVLIFLVAFTSASWLLSFLFAAWANKGPYPMTLFNQLEQRLNANLKETHTVKSLSAQDVRTLEIDANAVDLELATGESEQIEIALNGFTSGDQPLTVENRSGTLFVGVADGKSQVQWKFLSGPNISISRSLTLKVSVPPGFAKGLKAKTSSGDILLAEMQLIDVELNATSGDVEIQKAEIQSLNASTGSGDLNVSGKVTVFVGKSGSGDVSTNTLSGDTFDISTSSGGIFMADTSALVVQLQSGSGDVTVNLGKIEKWTANARTTSGDIRSDLPTDEKNERPEQLKIGKGPNQLNIKTGSGDVFLRL